MRIEQGYTAKMIHAHDVREGDLIDTDGWWEPMTTEAIAAECEYFEVDGFEVESPRCVRLDFVGYDSYGWPSDRPLLIQRRFNDA